MDRKDDFLETNVLEKLRDMGYQAEQSVSRSLDPNDFSLVYLHALVANEIGDRRVRDIRPPVVILAPSPDWKEARDYLLLGRTGQLAEYYISAGSEFGPYMETLRYLTSVGRIKG
ncbi:hypothetical protein A3K63_03070 [Candidatus Micrarchaeota archaeon RBG_16_49_10]|nr:MAG: hypothetical protein A3K63_03070 [Candidatus Micrarchaeota archaeon RBG_16_49_10]